MLAVNAPQYAVYARAEKPVNQGSLSLRMRIRVTVARLLDSARRQPAILSPPCRVTPFSLASLATAIVGIRCSRLLILPCVWRLLLWRGSIIGPSLRRRCCDIMRWGVERDWRLLDRSDAAFLLPLRWIGFHSPWRRPAWILVPAYNLGNFGILSWA
jgi:hypothetical protein